MKRVKSSMKEQAQRKKHLLAIYEMLLSRSDNTNDVGLKNVLRGDARTLKDEVDRITCYLDKCKQALTKPEGPSDQELANLHNFKYWQDS